jgi:hypothetical protein
LGGKFLANGRFDVIFRAFDVFRGRKWAVGMAAETTASDRNQRGQFISRNDAYRRGVAAKAALKAEITAELGGNLSTADAILLTRAVELLAVRPKSHTDAVRAANTANRILRTLRAKYAAGQMTPPHPLMTAREMLERLGDD